MATTKKADHRLVQPRPEHYKTRVREDGIEEQVLCGPYSLAQRNKYFSVMIGLYMTRHPRASHKQAKSAVFTRWRNLVFATIGDEYVPVTNVKEAKDAVKLYKSVGSTETPQ